MIIFFKISIFLGLQLKTAPKIGVTIKKLKNLEIGQYP